jgi:hypothetical protein
MAIKGFPLPRRKVRRQFCPAQRAFPLSVSIYASYFSWITCYVLLVPGYGWIVVAVKVASRACGSEHLIAKTMSLTSCCDLHSKVFVCDRGMNDTKTANLESPYFYVIKRLMSLGWTERISMTE